MQAEVSAVDDEREALAFAWGCLCAALGHALMAARAARAHVHHVGMVACSAAVLLGCVFMHSAGAPGRYLWMNLVSLAFAVATFRLLPRRRLQTDELLRAKLSFAIGAGLLIASVGQVSTGAAMWLRVGPVPLNLAWLLLPALLVASDVRIPAAATVWAPGGLLMACAALAVAGDMVLLGLAAVVLSLRVWHGRSGTLALLALAAWAMVIHLGQGWQAPEALAFVDRVLGAGLDQNLAVGCALALLQLLPLWPALRHRQARLHGLVWGLLVVLSLPGWLPSPLLGFGGSFIFAYLLSLSVLPGDSAGSLDAGDQPVAVYGRRHPPSLPRSGPI